MRKAMGFDKVNGNIFPEGGEYENIGCRLRYSGSIRKTMEAEMRGTRKLSLVLLGLMVLFLAAPAPCLAGKSAKELKEDAKRAEIDETAEAALQTVLKSSKKAAELFEKSYGWAVFDNFKLAFGISGGGGNGVAVDKSSGKRIYMKMGTVGVGFGLGGQKYQVVFFFQDSRTFNSFVDKGWKAEAGAEAVAGEDGANAKTSFTNGIAVFQVTEKGLMARADISGTKYWKNDKLND